MRIRYKPCKTWLRVRTRAYIRDKYKCVLCGRGRMRLDPHHILPKSIFKKLRYSISNLATLCRRCHRKTFRREHLFIKKIVANIYGSFKAWIYHDIASIYIKEKAMAKKKKAAVKKVTKMDAKKKKTKC